jgi:hypothetical protein
VTLRPLLWLLAWACIGLLVGCMKRADVYEGDYAESAGSWSGADEREAPRAAGAPPRGAPAAKSSSRVAAMGFADDAPAVAEEATAPAAPAARMVHYAGYARLRVVKVEEAIDAIGRLATEVGGFVEQVGPQSVVVRVPVDRFEERFAAVLSAGQVLDKSLSAQDVTEAFLAVELRLRTARATRDRLVELLAKATDEKEKLALLREIQRLEQEVDQLEGQGRTLSALASFSRISVDLVAREALAWQGAQAETLELAWIRALSPLRLASPVADPKRLPLALPQGMVRLEERGPFVAESADGARIWSHRLENEPDGDAAWWQAAMIQRLGPEFAAAERGEVGAWRTLRLVDRGSAPYTWLIAVRVDGDRLDLVQVYYPSAAAEARHGPAVQAALGGVGS